MMLLYGRGLCVPSARRCLHTRRLHSSSPIMSRSSLLLVALVALLATVVSAAPQLPMRIESLVAKEARLLDAAAWPQGGIIEDKELFNATSGGWVLYKQCGQSWSNNPLGTSSITICQAGCAMSSVTMALKTRGSDLDPGTYNTWLIYNGGYVSGNLLVWAAANAWGTITFQNYYTGYGSLSETALRGMISSRQPVVVNVRNGGHWVLVTGFAGGNTYTVNDSGFSTNTYQYTDMGNFVVYA